MPLRPHDRLTIGYVAATGVLIVFARKANFPCWEAFLALHALLIAGVWVLARHGADAFPGRAFLSRLARIARDFYPAALVPALYKELYFLIPAIHPMDRDAWLVAADRAIFGVVPAVALQAWAWPPAVEILQWAYASYFLIAVSLAAIFYAARPRIRFDEFLYAVLLVYFGSYAGYFLVPAVGPERALMNEFRVPLEGLFATAFLRDGIERLEWLQRDLFPSGHAAVSLVCVLYAFRFCRPAVAAAYALVGTLLIASTIYCRYHYAVDVFAGIPLALAGIWIAHRRFRGKEKEPAGAEAPTGPSETDRPA